MSSETTKENRCMRCKSRTETKRESGFYYDRYPGCQDHCEYGIADRNEREARRDKIAKERDEFYEWKRCKFQGETRSIKRFKS